MGTGTFLLPVGCALGLGLLALAGCTAGAVGGGNAANAPANVAAPTAGGGNRYKVSVESTPFYKLGPQQPSGPDLGLKQGTRLALVKRAYGFSQVQLEDGQTGFVGTADLAPLSPEEIAAEQKPPPPAPGANVASTNAQKKGRRSRPLPSGPLPVGAEPGLPSAEPPARSGPTPAFRY